ncbi:glycosyltransferase family 4 protein [Brumicola blandensis]|uniref:Glycosyltransferase family 4 protein n=1 Tax=Brumicola blandensis TaxID=3075611 RepID=A0AAW8R1W3_9ALTE|nr:glycosyltransferase family 4 protein [Alteromonas sp. W409]MDT0582709.1 glycosyltransferase family 4 protein [Alteromonas sp. W409]
MKIAQVITRSDTLGGASAHVRDLSNALIAQGHEVCVFVGGDGPLNELFERNKIPIKSVTSLVRELSPANDFKAYFELKKLLADYSPDIVACHSAKAGLLGRLAASKLNLPVVYTAHGWPFTEGVPNLRASIYRYVETFMANFCNNIITVSDYDKKLAVRHAVADESKIRVIWNGVPEDSLIQNRESKDSATLIPTILMIARFEQPKNFSLLLRALSGLTDLKWQAKFVGDGPDLTTVKSLCDELSLNERVSFLGWRNDIANLLSEADIFTLISDWEGLPLSILEAMRAGLPVIASDVGGVKEAVEHEQSGLLVSNKQVEEITTALQQLLTGKALRKDMGNKGRERFNTFFTVEKMTEATLSVYQQAIAFEKGEG